MADTEYEISLSGRGEAVNNINLRDYVPDALVKIYPYRAIYGGKNKTIIQSNTKTIVRISQKTVDDFENLQEDENGKLYMEIFMVIDNVTKKTVSSGTSTFIQDVRKIKTMTAITNDYVETTSDKPDFFTIGEPFDKDKCDSGEQIIYYGSKFTPSYQETKSALASLDEKEQWDIENEERLSEIVLQDVSELEEQFSKSKMFFRETSLPLNNISNISINVTPNIIIDRVKAKGVTADSADSELLDIDFNVTGENLSWFNVVPINVKDKLEVTTPWFDENITLDKLLIERIIEKQDPVNGYSWVQFCKDEGLDSTERDLVLDMLLYTYEYSSTFGKVPRTTTGSMVPKYTIGKLEKIFVSSMANTNPKSTITGLYKKWTKIYPYLVGESKEKVMKAMIAAISKEIVSDYSVAGGGNDFNKNVLPWRIKLVKSIETKIENPKGTTDADKEGNLILEDFFFKVDSSPYFNMENEKFVNQNDIDLSESKWIESERRIILPELPETIAEIDKINNISDFSTTTSRDLKYMLKLPLSNDEVNKLWSGDLGVTGLKTINIQNASLEPKINAYTSSEASETIYSQLLFVYSDVDESTIRITKPGYDIKIDEPLKYNVAQKFEENDSKAWIFVTGTSTLPKGTQAKSDPAFEAFIKSKLPKATSDRIKKELGYNPWKQTTEYGNEDRIFVGGDTWFGGTEEGLDIDHPGYVAEGNSDRIKMFKIIIEDFYKLKDPSDLIFDENLWSLSKTWYGTLKGATLGGYRKFNFSFNIIHHSWTGVEYSFQTNLPSKELVARKTIYDRPKWKQLIKSTMNPDNGIIRKLELNEKYEIGPYELREIIFSSIFGDKIWINFSNGDSIEIELSQRDDETISTTSIVFY